MHSPGALWRGVEAGMIDQLHQVAVIPVQVDRQGHRVAADHSRVQLRLGDRQSNTASPVCDG